MLIVFQEHWCKITFSIVIHSVNSSCFTILLHGLVWGVIIVWSVVWRWPGHVQIPSSSGCATWVLCVGSVIHSVHVDVYMCVCLFVCACLCVCICICVSVPVCVCLCHVEAPWAECAREVWLEGGWAGEGSTIIPTWGMRQKCFSQSYFIFQTYDNGIFNLKVQPQTIPYPQHHSF